MEFRGTKDIVIYSFVLTSLDLEKTLCFTSYGGRRTNKEIAAGRVNVALFGSENACALCSKYAYRKISKRYLDR